MKTAYLLLSCLFIQFNLFAQSSSDEAKVIFLVVDKNNKPIKGEWMLIESDKLTESITEVTDVNGKIKIVLPKSTEYIISF